MLHSLAKAAHTIDFRMERTGSQAVRERSFVLFGMRVRSLFLPFAEAPLRIEFRMLRLVLQAACERSLGCFS